MTNTVFSEYEARELGFKVGSEEAILVPCVGTVEEELEVKVISKKCRGVVKKKRPRGTGNGTIKITAHFPYELVNKLYAMNIEGLKDGVVAYGQKSLHPEFTLTMDVFDEDDNEKLKAYPCSIIESNLVRKIENGAEEVAEMDLEVSVMPDDDGQGMYECLVDDLTDQAVKTSWMSSFTSDLVKVETA